jgi:hypothetical protein
MLRSKWNWINLAFTLPALFLISTLLPAQEFRSTLTGTVTDPSGAVVPNAAVVAVNNSTQMKYAVTTTGKGDYFIPYVLPGTYTVTVSAPGFEKFVQTNVVLQAAKPFGLNVQLHLGSSAQTIEVTTAPPLLETANGSGGTILTQRELEDVPLNGRQVYTLLGTTPGSQFAQTQFGATGYSGTRGWDVSNNYTLGGGVVNYQQFTLNGTNVTIQEGGGSQGEGTWVIAPNVDALQEVNVMTTTYDARYGRTGGGTVNMVMKSGSNQFHGDAYDYLENGHLNANNFENNVTGNPRSMIHQNQFGGTFGGPIKKDKIFFFASYEGYLESIPFTTVSSTVPSYLRPTANGVDFNNTAQSGRIYQIYDPLTTVCNASGGTLANCPGNNYARTMFPNNTIPVTRISTAGAALLALYPLPNSGGAALNNNFVTNTPDVYQYHQPMLRVDYDTSDKTRWYSLFAFQHGTENRNENGFSGVAEQCNCDHMRQDLTASQDMTHIFTPTLLGDFKLSFSRYVENGNDGNLAAAVPASQIGLNMPKIPTQPILSLPEITMGGNGGFTGIVGNSISDWVYNNFFFDNDWTKTIGNHTIHFGGELSEYTQANPDSVGHPGGVFTFDSGNTQYNPKQANKCPNCSSNVQDGLDVADLLLGYPYSGSVDDNYTLFDVTPAWAAYVQDDWKVTPKLTVNIGLRYDVQVGTREHHNYLNRGICMTCVNPITYTPQFQANVNNPANIAAWTAAGIDPNSLKVAWGGLEFTGVNGQSRDAYNTDYTDFEPRFGFAYSFSPKTVIRGGYGIEYAVGLEGGNDYGATQNTGYVTTQSDGVTPTDYFASGNPYPNGYARPSGNTLGLLTNVGNQLAVDFPGRRIPRSQIFSLGFQHELPGRIVLDARYAGNYTDRLRNGTASSSGGTVWLNGTMPLSQYQLALADPNYFSKQVPNPYYGVEPITSSRGQNPTINAEALMTPYSDFNLIGQYDDPLGKENYNALEVKVNKQLSNGLSFQASYTYSKTMQRNGYINGWPYQDAQLLYQLVPTDRTHVFTLTAEYALPVGHGKALMAHGVLGQVVNDWNINWITSIQTGFPLGISQGNDYQCNHSYAPNGGSTNNDYLYNNYSYQYNGKTSPTGCWITNSTISPYFLNYLPQRIGQVRAPSVPDLDVSVMKNFVIRESVQLQIRADAMNITNTALRQAVQTDPTKGPAVYQGGVWNGFGTVNDQQYNFPRIIQLSAKLFF